MTLRSFIAFGMMLVGQGNPYWRLPATIELLRDVETHSFDPRAGEKRGVLSANGEAFQIRKGERFQMVKIYQEGGCRIRFKNMERDVTSCPWLEGFSDQQADIYKVVSGHLAAPRK